MQANPTHGFPDDSKASGPTIFSQSSLKAVSEWFPELDSPEIARRMRANLESTDTDTTTPFWEDCLFGKKDSPKEFSIGDVKFLGAYPCSRCIVPTRNSQTEEAYPQFQKIFSQRCQETLTAGVERSSFNHFYRFTVNTIIPATESGKILPKIWV